ncbi:MAG TPA: TIGR02444 family protein [Alphaproteobacteria bacterium]|nr:TIGR02444 family protein [Alphaproteobacteria bacterium]
MSAFPSCEFWDYSLELYGREGVAAACLALQERRGADVNLLLFCCWHGASGRGSIDGAALERAQKLVGSWHGEVVRGLRAVRTRLKREPGPAPVELAASLRKRIGAVEIEAEHIEQLLLFSLAAPAAAAPQPSAIRAGHVAGNMRRYLEALAGAVDEADRDALAAVLAGAFPELPATACRELLAAAN